MQPHYFPIFSVDQFHRDRKSTRLNSSHLGISYAVFCLKKKTKPNRHKRAAPMEGSVTHGDGECGPGEWWRCRWGLKAAVCGSRGSTLLLLFFFNTHPAPQHTPSFPPPPPFRP